MPALELQGAIYAALTGDAGVMALVSGVYDRVQRGSDGLPVPTVWGDAMAYVSFGPESTVASEAGCIGLDNVQVQLDIWSRRPGRVHCKQIMSEVRRVMAVIETVDNPIVARADPFAQIMLDPDGLTTRGLLRYEFEMEADHG